MDSDFEYKNGKFIPMENCPWGDGSDEELKKAGFTLSQQRGDDCGLCYTIYESSKGWVVCFNTASLYCNTFVGSWPDLVDILNRISLPVLASVFNDELAKCLRELMRPVRDKIERERIEQQRRVEEYRASREARKTIQDVLDKYREEKARKGNCQSPEEVAAAATLEANGITSTDGFMKDGGESAGKKPEGSGV